MAKLIVADGPEAGRSFELRGERMLLGRDEDCDIRLNHPSISRHHALFSRQGNLWRVEDLKSQNGTAYEGRSLDTPLVLLRSGQLRIGLLQVIYEGGGESMAEAGAAAPPAGGAGTVAGVGAPLAGGGSDRDGQGEVSPEEIRAMGVRCARILSEFSKVIVGQKQVVEELLTAIAAGGHCLMIGLPGLAKTLMVSTLAELLELRFKRVQFTPDLMPSDIIGTDVLDMDAESGRKSFRFIPGPVFTNMLLADEINRTPPKTQAALLEAMQEKQVTASNQIFRLPPPFFVLATQNPLEQEGTYPLPEAQLDRFMFNILVDYPSEQEEEQIIMATTGRRDVQLQKVMSAAELLRLQQMVRELPVSPHIVRYATRLVRLTRPGNPEAPDFIRSHLSCGAGPRAAQCLVLGAKARAVLQGRVNVSCDDIQALALPVLRHRLFTNFAADSEGIGPNDIIRRLLGSVAPPDEKSYGA